jgi:hypothetical protein
MHGVPSLRSRFFESVISDFESTAYFTIFARGLLGRVKTFNCDCGFKFPVNNHKGNILGSECDRVQQSQFQLPCNGASGSTRTLCRMEFSRKSGQVEGSVGLSFVRWLMG